MSASEVFLNRARSENEKMGKKKKKNSVTWHCDPKAKSLHWPKEKRSPFLSPLLQVQKHWFSWDKANASIFTSFSSPSRSVSHAFTRQHHILFTALRLLVQDLADWPLLPISCARQERSHSITCKAEPHPEAFLITAHCWDLCCVLALAVTLVSPGASSSTSLAHAPEQRKCQHWIKLLILQG